MAGGRHAGGQFSAIDVQAYRSGLRHLNPAYKITVSLLLLLQCVLLRNTAASLFVLLSSAAIVCAGGKTPIRTYLSVLTAPLIFILLGTVAIAVEIGREPVGEWCLRLGGLYFCVSRGGFLRAAQIFTTALGAVAALYLQTMTTPVNEITSTMARLHMPALLIELSYLIYRFIFVLSDAARQIHVSAQSRLGYCGLRRSLRTFGASMGTLLVSSLRLSGDYYDAMLARCYDGRLLFLEEKKPVTVPQLLLAGLYVLCPVGIALLTR
ncbi:MAG: cobalt ECF transporter T component CbiQ [Oscillospiraceae bacterium]|nr:cobalt ECF transporter T component CbiQ [Oscillospiraceae bacterium]